MGESPVLLARRPPPSAASPRTSAGSRARGRTRGQSDELLEGRARTAEAAGGAATEQPRPEAGRHTRASRGSRAMPFQYLCPRCHGRFDKPGRRAACTKDNRRRNAKRAAHGRRLPGGAASAVPTSVVSASGAEAPDYLTFHFKPGGGAPTRAPRTTKRSAVAVMEPLTHREARLMKVDGVDNPLFRLPARSPLPRLSREKYFTVGMVEPKPSPLRRSSAEHHRASGADRLGVESVADSQRFVAWERVVRGSDHGGLSLMS